MGVAAVVRPDWWVNRWRRRPVPVTLDPWRSSRSARTTPTGSPSTPRSSNAARAVDSPWQHPVTLLSEEGRFRYGWDGEVEAPYVGLVDGAPVAVGRVATTEYDNLHLAWLGVQVPSGRTGVGATAPGCWRRWSRRPGPGAGRRSASTAGTTRPREASRPGTGWRRRARAINAAPGARRGGLGAIERLHAEASAAASAYEIVRREGARPTTSSSGGRDGRAINDAPTDDLDIEDEVFSAERVRAYEDAQLAKGDRLFRVFARHRETGELAGHTVVVVDGERPDDRRAARHLGRARHRGHRLGLLLKTDMNLGCVRCSRRSPRSAPGTPSRTTT